MSDRQDNYSSGADLRDRPEQEILRSLRRILRAVDRHSRSLVRQHGLTEPQVICLHAIERAGEVNPSQLARSLSLSPPTVTGILDRLERRELIKRERTVRDRRQVVVRLTPHGRETLQRTPLPLQDRFTRRLAALPVSAQQRIATVLEEVVKLMEAENIDAAPLLAQGVANPAKPDSAPWPAANRARTGPGTEPA